MAKTAGFAILESPKLISHKIWVIEKWWNFYTVNEYLPKISWNQHTWLFFICFKAKDRFFVSPAIWTNSTRPNPPTPNVAIILKSDNFKDLNSWWTIFFLSLRSTYLVLISSKLAIKWLNESRSITRQVTPVSSSAIMLAVLFSSLEN